MRLTQIECIQTKTNLQKVNTTGSQTRSQPGQPTDDGQVGKRAGNPKQYLQTAKKTFIQSASHSVS